jgi:hypothetical protein
MSSTTTEYSRPGKGQVFVAAFGKHPGWSDFMDDIGMKTDTLIATKRALYLEGLTSQIETGAWAKLEPSKRINDFNHLFLWRRPEEFLIGRIWSSVDAKGRREYPMVACADCIGLPVAWVLDELPPLLEEIRTGCQAAKSAEEVSAVLAKAQNAIQERLADATTFITLGAPDTQAAHAQFLNRREWGPTQEGLYRILHQMHGQFQAYGLGRQVSFSETVFLRKGPQGGSAPLSQQIRVPQAADTPAASLRQWIDFFLHKLNAATPIFLVLCVDHKWVDATIGEPTSREFFSFKASRAALPLANDVPYELDEESREFAREFIASYGVLAKDGGKNVLRAIRIAVGISLLLVLVGLFVGYLHSAPPGDIPGFLRGAAQSLGNPGLSPVDK